MIDHHTQRLLDSLLGPSEPDLSCERCFEELDLYVELEVQGADRDAAVPSMQAHLCGCPACREDYESLLALVGEAGT